MYIRPERARHCSTGVTLLNINLHDKNVSLHEPPNLFRFGKSQNRLMAKPEMNNNSGSFYQISCPSRLWNLVKQKVHNFTSNFGNSIPVSSCLSFLAFLPHPAIPSSLLLHGIVRIHRLHSKCHQARNSELRKIITKVQRNIAGYCLYTFSCPRKYRKKGQRISGNLSSASCLWFQAYIIKMLSK